MKIIRAGITIENIDIPEIKEEKGIDNIAIGFTKETYDIIEKLQLDKEEVESKLFTVISQIFSKCDINNISTTQEKEEINKLLKEKGVI